jgi:acyl-CoA synthetase (NDP forming)
MVAAGVETIVGLVTNPSFGPLVAFGMGGPAAELLLDRAFRILPLTDLDAAELVRAPRSAPLLFGHRGAPPADVAALEELLLRVARLAEDVPEVVEVVLDPVLVGTTGVVAVDARVRLGTAAVRERSLRRLRDPAPT